MDYRGSNCSSHHPVRRVEAECQGRQTCSLMVSSASLMADWSEPWCPHTTKQLSVSHQCRPASLRTRLNCPASPLVLTCRQQPNTNLFVMVSSDSSDRETLAQYCGPQHRGQGGQVGGSTNSSLTRLVVAACHGLVECEVSLPSPHLTRTVYSCVSQGVINIEQIQQYRTSTTLPTTSTTTSTITTTTTTTTITSPSTTSMATTELTMIETTRTSSIDFTSFKTFIPKENKKVNKSLENDQQEHQVVNIVVLKFKLRFVQSPSFPWSFEPDN